MYLFFDTETTGLPLNWKAPVTDLKNWPRLVQLAYLQYDAAGNLLAEGNHIIRPEGFTISATVAKVHRISQARALKEGIALSEALQAFQSLLEKSSCLVAHNMSFDEKILGAEFLRQTGGNALQGKAKICTMDKSTNFCAIKGPYGYKWPKLSELHFKLFGSEFEEAHDAAVDIRITAKCFWALKGLGKI